MRGIYTGPLVICTGLPVVYAGLLVVYTAFPVSVLTPNGLYWVLYGLSWS